MIARATSMEGFEAAGLIAGALLAVTCVPGEAMAVSVYPPVADSAAVTEIEQPALKVADQQDVGWWVVLATVPADQDVREAVQTVKACGLRPFNDFSGKFSGFASGFQVVVDGAYASRLQAERVRMAASRCVPNAYVKWARYLGE